MDGSATIKGTISPPSGTGFLPGENVVLRNESAIDQTGWPYEATQSLWPHMLQARQSAPTIHYSFVVAPISTDRQVFASLDAHLADELTDLEGKPRVLPHKAHRNQWRHHWGNRHHH